MAKRSAVLNVTMLYVLAMAVGVSGFRQKVKTMDETRAQAEVRESAEAEAQKQRIAKVMAGWKDFSSKDDVIHELWGKGAPEFDAEVLGQILQAQKKCAATTKSGLVRSFKWRKGTLETVMCPSKALKCAKRALADNTPPGGICVVGATAKDISQEENETCCGATTAGKGEAGITNLTRAEAKVRLFNLFWKGEKTSARVECVKGECEIKYNMQ